MMKNNGIAIMGSVILDKICEIASYPPIGELTKISSVSNAVGGCVPNVASDIKRISPDIPVWAVGRVGADAEGEYIRDYLIRGGVDTSGLITDNTERTSFTEVMSITGGQRTFFTYAGASALLGAEDIDFNKISPKIMLLGYFLLLDKMDSGDGAILLEKAQKAGVKTAIDLVSENSDRYSLVLPALKYTDYLIVNEIEAGGLAGIEPTDENLEAIARKLRSLGVSEKVIIHKSDRAVILSDEGYTVVASYDVPKSDIVGTTGAGDAFCSGALIAIYNGLSDREILEFASSAAVSALFSADATSGVVSADEIKKIVSKYQRKSI